MRKAAVLLRLTVGHLLAYPITMAVTLGNIPVLIVLSEREVLSMPEEKAIVDLILRRLLWPAIVAGVLAHTPSLEWAFAPAEKDARARRRFWVAEGALLGLGALYMLGAWAWFMWKTS